MFKISIVAPLYNSFHMLERGLEVLSKQKAASIELILVDDCSKDDSFQKAQEYAKNSSFDMIVLQNEKNGGPGVSRNNGIAHATGDYITFMDSDDYFSDDFTEALVPILENGADCVIFDYQNVDAAGAYLSSGTSIAMKGLREGWMDTKEAFVFTQGTTWGKIYKRDVIERSGARFGEYFRNEDTIFTKHAIAFSEKVWYCARPLYRYVQFEGSLMHNTALLDESNCQRSFALIRERLQGQDLDEELLAVQLIEALNTTVLIKTAKKEPRKEIIRYIRENYSKKHIRNKYFALHPLYRKIVSCCAYYKCILLLKLIVWYKNRR